MCQRITCPNCGKPTWEGCGEHVEQALAGVAPAERCTCPRDGFGSQVAGRTYNAPLGGTSAGSW